MVRLGFPETNSKIFRGYAQKVRVTGISRIAPSLIQGDSCWGALELYSYILRATLTTRTQYSYLYE
eukprot:scaffold420854_cov50-Prasinocladus_malaysianus.AAC.1